MKTVKKKKKKDEFKIEIVLWIVYFSEIIAYSQEEGYLRNK